MFIHIIWAPFLNDLKLTFLYGYFMYCLSLDYYFTVPIHLWRTIVRFKFELEYIRVQTSFVRFYYCNLIELHCIKQRFSVSYSKDKMPIDRLCINIDRNTSLYLQPCTDRGEERRQKKFLKNLGAIRPICTCEKVFGKYFFSQLFWQKPNPYGPKGL